MLSPQVGASPVGRGRAPVRPGWQVQGSGGGASSQGGGQRGGGTGAGGSGPRAAPGFPELLGCCPARAGRARTGSVRGGVGARPAGLCPLFAKQLERQERSLILTHSPKTTTQAPTPLSQWGGSHLNPPSEVLTVQWGQGGCVESGRGDTQLRAHWGISVNWSVTWSPACPCL